MYLEDFAPGQGFLTQGRTITETDIVQFGGWSWDTNPVHTDAEHMRGSRFGAPIAHGLLGVSVAMGLVSRLGVFEKSSIALLGIDEWRFIEPVHVGDTVRCRLEILGVRTVSSGSAGVLDRRLELLNQRDVVTQRGRISLMVALRP